MKKAISIASLILLCLSGCRKDPETSTSQASHNIKIEGSKDLTLYTIDSSATPLKITGSNQGEYAKLSIVGLPYNVSAGFEPFIGIANFATYLSIKCNNAAAGAYKLKSIVTTESGQKDSFDLNLNITVDANCSDKLAGTYNATYECFKSATYMGTVNISPIDAQSVSIRNLKVLNQNLDSIAVSVNCDEYSLNIPDQWETNGHHILSGHGACSYHNVELTYTIATQGTCTATLTKQ